MLFDWLSECCIPITTIHEWLLLFLIYIMCSIDCSIDVLTVIVTKLDSGAGAVCLDWYVVFSAWMNPDLGRILSSGFFFSLALLLGNLRKHKKGKWWYCWAVIVKNILLISLFFCCYVSHQMAASLAEQLCLAISSMSPSTIVAKYVFTYLLSQLLLWDNVVQVCNKCIY